MNWKRIAQVPFWNIRVTIAPNVRPQIKLDMLAEKLREAVKAFMEFSKSVLGV